MARYTAHRPIDEHIGRRIRGRRKLLRMSQPELASALGVKYQQIQKYERGEDGVSAARLWVFGRTLEVGVDYFYEGLESTRGEAPHVPGDVDESYVRREARELKVIFERANDTGRAEIFETARRLCQSQSKN